MAVLNDFQKLTRVLPGQPFGNGSDGAYSSATIPTIKYKTCSGTATSTTLTADTDASPFVVGDVVGIFQSRGTGVGQWEINRISTVGSDQYTLQVALQYTYTDSGASQAQVVKILQYTDVTVQSGTWTLTGRDGDIGGILPLAIKGTMTVTGTVNGKGTDGTTSVGQPSAGGGYLGGESKQGGSTQAGRGEGINAARNAAAFTADGTAAGGAYSGDGRAFGGGGGYATSGETGSDEASLTEGGVGGGTSGQDDLTNIIFGGAGGGASDSFSSTTGSGANSGAIVILFVKNLSISGSATVNGGEGGNGATSKGGSGSGGSLLIVTQTATLGTNLATAVGGTVAANGGNGRIAIHHSATVTGTTNPTFTDVTDGSLVESTASFMFFGY